MHQQLVHVMRNTAQQASYVRSRAGIRTKRKISCGGTNCSNTHNIISLMAPHEISVIPRATTDEFKVLPMEDTCELRRCRALSKIVMQ